MAAWGGEGTFQDLLAADPEVKERLPRADFEALFDPGFFVRHVDAIYARVFAAEGAAASPAGRMS
jgi:adenylosuccinate lyase